MSPGRPESYRFLLDEDLRPSIAVVARGLELDVVSVHELGRLGLSDEDQLRWAANEGRIVLTSNRDDFIEWTTIFFQRAESHSGVLIVPTLLSIQRPERVAHALARWVDRMRKRLGERSLSPYFVDFLEE